MTKNKKAILIESNKIESANKFVKNGRRGICQLAILPSYFLHGSFKIITSILKIRNPFSNLKQLKNVSIKRPVWIPSRLIWYFSYFWLKAMVYQLSETISITFWLKIYLFFLIRKKSWFTVNCVYKSTVRNLAQNSGLEQYLTSTPKYTVGDCNVPVIIYCRESAFGNGMWYRVNEIFNLYYSFIDLY